MKRLILCLMAAALLLTGCGTQVDKEGDGKPVVYASFYPIYDLVQAVAGDTVTVRSFMPMDKDPHLWEPTPRDLKRLSDADLLVVNGANMERWLEQVRENLPDLPILILSDFVELITYKGAAAMGDFQYMAKVHLKKGPYAIDFGHTHEDIMRVAFMKDHGGESNTDLINRGKKAMEKKGPLIAQKSTIQVENDTVYNLEMGHERGIIYYEVPEEGDWYFISDRVSEKMLPYELVDLDENLLEKEVILSGSTSGFDKITYDPHSWISIVNAKTYLNAIQDKLTELYPEEKRAYKRNKLNAVDELTALQYEYRAKLKDIENRHFVVTHYAYAYLARDFELFQFPLQGLISTESPSLKTIRKAIDICRYYHINTIFYEQWMGTKNAKSLAEEIGGKIVPLVSMEYVTEHQREGDKHYIDFMRENLANIYESLVTSDEQKATSSGS